MRILLLQELVDAVQIVEGVVDEEAKFGDDAQLVVYTLPQFVADGLLVGIDIRVTLTSTPCIMRVCVWKMLASSFWRRRAMRFCLVSCIILYFMVFVVQRY